MDPKIIDTEMPNLAIAAINNVLNYYIELFQSSPSVEISNVPELGGLFYSDEKNGGGSVIIHASFLSEQSDAKIKQVIKRSHERNHFPITWVVNAVSKPDNLGQRLEENGFQHLFSMPAMATVLENIQLQQVLPRDLVIEPVRNFDQLQQWMDVLEAGYHIDEADRIAFSAYFQKAGFSDEVPHQLFVGSIDGQPVATSQVFNGGGVTGIYKVAVLPSMRRRKFGAAMTIASARAGLSCEYKVGVLFATEDGVPLYQSLGFKEYFQMKGYVLEKTAA